MTTAAALTAALTAPVDTTLDADLRAGVTGRDIQARVAFMTDETADTLSEDAWSHAFTVTAFMSDATVSGEDARTLAVFDAGRDAFLDSLQAA